MHLLTASYLLHLVFPGVYERDWLVAGIRNTVETIKLIIFQILAKASFRIVLLSNTADSANIVMLILPDN